MNSPCHVWADYPCFWDPFLTFIYHFWTVGLPVSPGDEYDVTFLCIKREIFDVESTIRLDKCRIQPQYLPARRHNSICYHEVIKLIASTEKQINKRFSLSFLVQVWFCTWWFFFYFFVPRSTPKPFCPIGLFTNHKLEITRLDSYNELFDLPSYLPRPEEGPPTSDTQRVSTTQKYTQSEGTLFWTTSDTQRVSTAQKYTQTEGTPFWTIYIYRLTIKLLPKVPLILLTSLRWRDADKFLLIPN